MTDIKNVKIIDGGVCAAKGFKAAGTACGIKGRSGKKDLALIVSSEECSAAAVYTTNKVKGAPLSVTRRNISDGRARAVICNSGNANTCAPNGADIAEKTCMLTADALGIAASDVVVASTGVIGQELYIEPFEKGIPVLVEGLREDGSSEAAEAIMTTDTIPKEIAVEFELGGITCRMGGIAKGSGMINPNMATMLSFITTDVFISPELLDKALKEDVKTSFNQICVDGDTSTNDMVVVLANGLAGNSSIDAEGEAFDKFKEALSVITTYLAKRLARDGEGATKLIECNVKGAADEKQARNISKTVISSDLFKAAMFGEDANWGRVLCAIGYTPGDFQVDNIDVEICSAKGSITVCSGSGHEDFSEEEALDILSEEEIRINVDMNQGSCQATAWGCDLTYEYVRINGDYRS
ncbi:MAG: bifunctional glutamate N-acetyltransferase/amino-acid acetyltransferase ArgJ [Anaerovoracaceae bacterium]|nr:bifunctional glutamate N-acetyltransferase/amino-acid acetyltransferase ArgJ [Anaerovoracaceae bacterium]